MAIDSKAKRLSILNVNLPWHYTLPDPDGSFSQGDRQHLLHHYSGLAFDAPVADVATYPGAVTFARLGPGSVTTAVVGPASVSVASLGLGSVGVGAKTS